MRIQFQSLHGHAAALQRSPEGRDWLHRLDGVHADLCPGGTNSTGWILQCPYAFEATWNGGNEDSAITVRTEDPRGAGPSFAQSDLGGGVLTLHTGYQVRTSSGQALWIRGPINMPKDGLSPLEQIVDASLFPFTVVTHVQLTRPGSTIRFEAGEPFCSIVPYPREYSEKFVVDVTGIESNLEAYEEELQKLIDAPSVQLVMEKLGDVEGAAASERANTDDEALFLPHPHVIPPPPIMDEESRRRLFKGTHPARISVIMAASNESIFLKRTVDQFEATLPSDSEIIVVDDGSTDGCADFLAVGRRDNVHLVRNQAPLGLIEARNRGVARAQGEVVVFADAHVDVPERWWQPLVAALNRSDVGVVGPGLGVMGKPELPTAYGRRLVEPTLRLEWLFDRPDAPCAVPVLGPALLAMHRDTLEDVGAFDSTISWRGLGALELCVRYWLLGHEVWIVPQVIVLRHFRKTPSRRVDGGGQARDMLRLAFLHFSPERIGAVVAGIGSEESLHDVLRSVADGALLDRRADFAERRVRDDEWLFEEICRN